MLTIDGSQGEGGGQILRTSLALSVITGQPFRIDRIRANRSKPGLMRQHLTAVLAAAEIGQAKIAGAALGSSRLDFTPGEIRPGEYRFSVGTAGSTTLILQTVLPPLLTAAGPSQLTFEGGTHNPHAPPFDFLQKAFLPLINQMGPRVAATLEKPGFYPAGGGRFQVTIEPASQLKPLELLERGKIRRRFAKAVVSNLARHIAEREIGVVRERLGWDRNETRVEELAGAQGPGNIVLLEIQSEHVTEIFTGFGERGVRAETVAEKAADEAAHYLEHGAPAGEHLADQLLLPLALAGGGAFRTGPLSLHAETNMNVIKLFLDRKIKAQPADERGQATTISIS